MKRINVSSGSPWESLVGYSRAVRKGSFVCVSGTTASDEEGNVIGRGDPHAQAVFIFQKIATALQKCGASLSDVVRTRMFVTNIKDWEAVGKVHADVLGDVQPASTLVEVSKLVHPDLLVEIEVDAIVNEA